MVNSKGSAPEFVKYIGPVISALTELGGSGRPDEVRSAIARALNIPEEEQARPLPSGVQSRFENQVHWARFSACRTARRYQLWMAVANGLDPI